jgi:hypothetical protein
VKYSATSHSCVAVLLVTLRIKGGKTQEPFITTGKKQRCCSKCWYYFWCSGSLRKASQTSTGRHDVTSHETVILHLVWRVVSTGTWRSVVQWKSKRRHPAELCVLLASFWLWVLAWLGLLTCSCETSVDFQPTTRHYIPGDRTLHNHRCKRNGTYRIRAEELVR